MRKVLVVDDHPVNRLLMQTILESGGYECLEAADGSEGLRIAAAQRPALVIIDLHMPGMAGTEFLKALRAVPGLETTPVALYTATAPNDDLRQFAELNGVGAIIPKPSEPKTVLDMVTALSGGAER